jgi:hypothetical protein
MEFEMPDTENVESLVLERLRDIREVLGKMQADRLEDRASLRRLEQGQASLKSDMAHTQGYLAEVTLRMDRMGDRLERIETQLGLVEAG